MKCANCGADIPAGMLICPDCGTEVQMVPDYNPLDDVLTREVKGSVEDVTRPLPNSSGQVQQQRNRSRQQPQNSTRVLSQGELAIIAGEIQLEKRGSDQQDVIQGHNRRIIEQRMNDGVKKHCGCSRQKRNVEIR